MLDELLEESPLAWMVETDTGLVIDARMLPATLQRALAADGLIPYATV